MNHLRFLTFISLLWVVASDPSTNDQKKVVCYFDSWSVSRPGNGQFNIEDIDPSLCTHSIYAFARLSASNIQARNPQIDLPDDNGKDGYGKFIALREKYPASKFMVAIGGWHQGSEAFSKMAETSESREKFVDNAVEFVKKYKFDGFDIDWEYPAQRGGNNDDIENFVLLLKALKTRFKTEGLILSIAVGAAESSASKSYNIPEIVKYVDFINLMSYNFYGFGTKTNMHSPLYNKGHSVKAAIDYWLSEGAPKEKLVVGLKLYGRSFTLEDPNLNDVGAPIKGKGLAGPYTKLDGALSYNEICEKIIEEEGWQIKRDSEAHMAYAFKGDQWVGYDDAQSARDKAEVIKEMDLAGAMIWSISADDFRGICGPKYPILNALNDVLRKEASKPDL